MADVTVQSRGAQLAARESRHDGEPILMLHGGPGVPDSLQTAVAQLLPDHRCISFDQRGVGHSRCDDGAYDIQAYLDDIESVRRHFALERWNVFGHSWGGLLAQAYTAQYPMRVDSLALSSSSLGVGRDWKRTKREAFRTDRERSGIWGTARFLAFGMFLYARPTRAWAMRHVMTETWHNYFLEPKTAPDPEPEWLDGCSGNAMLATDRAVSREPVELLRPLAEYTGPVLVLYGEHDIFGSATDIVRDRFPSALHVTLEGSGHLHWLDNPERYAHELRAFYRERHI